MDFGEWCESIGGKYTEYLSGFKECEVDVHSLKDLNKTIRDFLENGFDNSELVVVDHDEPFDLIVDIVRKEGRIDSVKTGVSTYVQSGAEVYRDEFNLNNMQCEAEEDRYGGVTIACWENTSPFELFNVLKRLYYSGDTILRDAMEDMLVFE